MQEYIGYIRVSTVKQGTQGVSLSEQRDAISRYAARNHYSVDLWLEEMETAAKGGRPIFDNAMKLLRRKKYRGIILHKLDRGARNLKDWVEIGDLSDLGIEVHFVNESLDLQSRGGRLSADIQAVVSADYIRNLKEEARKGFYGRLKQGLYPLEAPIGYKDEGGGKAKTIDPVKGPLVRRLFELYATAQHNLDTLSEEAFLLGLRGRYGGRISRSTLSILLNNPFYFGLIRIRRTNETFPGIHEPLIRKSLFDRVQKVLVGKTNTKVQQHEFLFRRLISCATCNYSLVGELQKGHVYYRCHNKKCPPTCIRETLLEEEFEKFLQSFRFTQAEQEFFKTRITVIRSEWMTKIDEVERSLKLQLDQLKDRLNRLTDAYLDQMLDKVIFEERRKDLLLAQQSAKEKLRNIEQGKTPGFDKVEKFLELAGDLWLSHQLALPHEKRELMQIVTSNRKVEGKKLYLEPSIAFSDLANRPKNSSCPQQRDIPRTLDEILDHLTTLNTRDELPDLSAIMDSPHADESACTDDEQDDSMLLAA